MAAGAEHGIERLVVVVVVVVEQSIVLRDGVDPGREACRIVEDLGAMRRPPEAEVGGVEEVIEYGGSGEALLEVVQPGKELTTTAVGP